MLTDATPTPMTARSRPRRRCATPRPRRAKLRSILDAASDGVVVLDHDGRVLSVNRGAEVLFGYESREMTGLPFASLFAPESQRAALDDLDRLRARGTRAERRPRGHRPRARRAA